MNRYDWLKVLTKGFPPPKNNIGKLQKKLDLESGAENNVSECDNTNRIIDIPESPINKKFTKEKLAQIRQEEINQIRNEVGIKVIGSDVSAPINSFEQLNSEYGVSNKIIKNLYDEKYEKPTPIQMQAWSLLFKRREILACAPTGSGKTAGYLVPIINHLKIHRKRGFRALILAPTRELATQIVRECDRLTEGLGLKASMITKPKVSNPKNKFFNKIDILVTTPNRLIYLMQTDEVLTNILNRVEWLIVDESDKLFEDGAKGFRDQLSTIFKACSGPSVVRAMFSATLSYDVEHWCSLNLNDVVTVTIGTRNTVADVEQHLNFCGGNSGKLMELHNIFNNGYEIPCLIFVQTKERAKKLCSEILLTNRPVRAMHSEMTQFKRDEIVREFREKKIWILVCTELMSRGIDFKGVNLVINYDFPPSIVSYVHRVGRTGRAGKKGKAITFWTMHDRPLLRSIAQVIKDSGYEVPDWILTMKSSSTESRKKYAKYLPDRGIIGAPDNDNVHEKSKIQNSEENKNKENKKLKINNRKRKIPNSEENKNKENKKLKINNRKRKIPNSPGNKNKENKKLKTNNKTKLKDKHKKSKKI